MSTSIPSPNMNMPVPVVGQDPDPQWALDINSCLSILDQHDHSPGYGVPVTPSGLNISSDLTFAGNNATTLRSLRFQPQSAALSAGADIGCLYEVTNDLYYNDGVGNQVRITQGGSVTGASGTITGLPSGTASASFSAGVFTFNASTNTGANMSIASLLLRNNSAGSHVLTLTPPTAMGADFSITLPSLPGATNILSMDSSGNMGAAINVDNSTLQLSSNTLAIKAQGVTQGLLALKATGTTVAAGGFAISASSGVFTTTSVTPVPVTNLSVTITTLGRPVFVGLIDDGAGSNTSIGTSIAAGISVRGFFFIKRSGTVIASPIIETASGASGTLDTYIPSSALSILDVVSAGTYTYTIEINGSAGSQNTYVNHSKLIAYEI